MITRRFHAGLGAAAQVRGAGAQQRHAVLGGQRPHRVPRRSSGCRRTRRSWSRPAGRDEVVPHHPARRGVPEKRVLFAEVEAERHRLQVSSRTRPVLCTIPWAGRWYRGEQHPRGWLNGTARGPPQRTRRTGPAESPGRRVRGQPQPREDDRRAEAGQQRQQMWPWPCLLLIFPSVITVFASYSQ